MKLGDYIQVNFHGPYTLGQNQVIDAGASTSLQGQVVEDRGVFLKVRVQTYDGGFHELDVPRASINNGAVEVNS